MEHLLNDLSSRLSSVASDEELESIISNELSKTLENISFKQYFRHNLGTYCNFISLILNKIKSVKTTVLFLQNELVFDRNFIREKQFCQNFLEITFPVLINLLCKHQDQRLYEEICIIFKKVILNKKSMEFQNYLETVLKLTENKAEEKFEIPKALLKIIGTTYNSHIEGYSASKVIFQSIINSFKDFRLIYAFTIVIIEVLGFDLSRDFSIKKVSKFSSPDIKISKSLIFLSQILQIMKEHKCELDCSVIINFSQFMENLANSILNLTTKPNKHCYEILEYTIDIHPSFVEKCLSNLVAYSMFSDNSECEENYTRFMLKVFETYAKLHRIQNLISKMLPILKSINDNSNFEEYYMFKGSNDLQQKMERNLLADKVLPDEVLKYFSQCVMQMTSWQFMNVFKTLIFHLDTTVVSFMELNEGIHNSFLELICKLTSELLKINRIDENTTTPKIIDNYIASMGNVKNILNKFGGALLEREHDQLLVRVFLDLSNNWAERMLYYYNTGYFKDEGIFSDVNHPSYLFSFLTNEQWILLSQRIMNFGESNCKYLMLILTVKKLSAMSLGNKIDENTQQEAIHQITSNMESACEYIVSERFISKHLVQKLDSDVIMHICDNVLSLLDNRPNMFRQTCYSEVWRNALSYVLLKKIAKTLSKGKSSSPLKKLMSAIDGEICNSNSEEEEIYLKKLKNVFEEHLWIDADSCKKDCEDKVQTYATCLMHLDFSLFSTKLKSLILLGLFLLHKHFWGSKCEFKDILEDWIKYSIQEIKIDLTQLFEPVSLVQNLTSNFNRKEELIIALSETSLKNEDTLRSLIPGINYLLKDPDNAANLQYSLLFLKDLKKMKKSEFCSELRDKILHVNFEVVTTKEANVLLIPSYVCCLKHWIVLEQENKLGMLIEKLDEYVEIILGLESCILPKGSASLFGTVLPNKHIFKISIEFPLKIWTHCKTKSVDSIEEQDFSRMFCLIFEHVQNDTFAEVSSDLLNMTIESINKRDSSKLLKHLQICTLLLHSSLNPVKFELRQKFLEELMIGLDDLKKDIVSNQEIFHAIGQFEMALINEKHLILSPAIMSMLLMSIYSLLQKPTGFYENFTSSTNYMECLLKHRSSMIMDRISCYLKVFRRLLFSLCSKCNEEVNNNNLSELEDLTDCAHQLEKLIRHLVLFKKDISRISCHLLQDILFIYETLSLFPKVKVHLNNMMFSLLSGCDHHAVAYLHRVLSSGSTELFKKVLNEYKRFHRFTGKV
ncbi:uncharacterized protein LOC123306560 [Coccinella septempunctata]|uniref:uncharacterized protein LOC123306560 n=1 Tax=Coccinella septempunctata TaxID=41139 RepID=UPI001D06C13A|nr:uncharacterized protein LOC123306560 [Coccinella septempunctata]XP_044744546.1 uncharacterized protein LOC123306560 [Coccinella septempunctata]XP_044744547.1 uncharacterized protein LOC123306560 [Coccinella septempunctata]